MKKHQIMVFVGNGFDMAVLKKYGKGITTSYESFYSFFKYKYPNNTNNLLIQQMERAKSEGKNNWSDFEEILYQTLLVLPVAEIEQIYKLNNDLSEIQQAFSRFLNDVIDNDIISSISKANDVAKEPLFENCAKTTLKCSFLKDLSKEQYEIMSFHNNFDNHELLKYVFINFNYTSLLDNYLYLNKKMFDPEPFYTSNNNFVLNLNPNKYKHCGFADPFINLLPIDIFHPHGIQDVPKSLLFGIENKNYCKQKDPRHVFVKSYWAQCQTKYYDKFNETELFIIYGCSIGESDNWWWNRIFDRLVSENTAELIIYNYGNESEDEIKEKFIRNCCLENFNFEEINKAKKNTYIINFGYDDKNCQEFMSLPELSNEMIKHI